MGKFLGIFMGEFLGVFMGKSLMGNCLEVNSNGGSV